MFTIAVDIGGTFTDVFVVDEEIKRTFISKAATTPDDLLVGVMTELDEAAAQMGLNIEKLLKEDAVLKADCDNLLRILLNH